MKFLPILRTLKRTLSRYSSLLLMFQKSPIIQMLFPEANFLASSAAMNSTGVAIATHNTRARREISDMKALPASYRKSNGVRPLRPFLISL